MPLSSPTLPTSPSLMTGIGESATESIFGPLLSRYDVEKGVLETLAKWFPTYCAEIERKEGFQPRTLVRPPAPESYHGGVDFDSYDEGTTPEVIVVCNPSGNAERYESEGYSQTYEIQVGVVCFSEKQVGDLTEEDDARLKASFYGAATQLLVQQPVSVLETDCWTTMIQSPRVDLPDPDERRRALSVSVFHTFVSTIVREGIGPTGEPPLEDPSEEPYPERPVVGSDSITVHAESVSEQVH
jgi:hypothetical protein